MSPSDAVTVIPPAPSVTVAATDCRSGALKPDTRIAPSAASSAFITESSPSTNIPLRSLPRSATVSSVSDAETAGALLPAASVTVALTVRAPSFRLLRFWSETIQLPVESS